jgi:hypothetical protein
MAPKFSAKGAVKRRTELRKEFWPKEVAWEGPAEIGYFCSPRTLPLVLQALRAKGVSKDRDPSFVYVDLLSRHLGQGVVELTHEDDHAYASGYTLLRSWRDRMAVLEKAGFIRTTTTGNRKYAKVFLVHPAIAMQKLRDNKLISEELWQAYRSRAIDAGELTSEVVSQREAALPTT